MTRWTLLLLGVGLLGGCKACRGGTDDGEDSDSADSQDSEVQDSEDTAIVVPPRCAINEVEPNNAPGFETPLPLERLACGEINPVLDADQWQVNVTQATWIAVDVEAEAIGSRADMGVILVDTQRGESAQWFDGPTGKDVHLRWPALPGTYNIALTELDARGGEDDWTYEILVSEVKEPLVWSGVEAEPNSTLAAAQPALVGAPLFGTISDAFDQDWYAVDIPAGKHELSVRIDAYTLGSAAQLRITLVRPNGVVFASVNGNEQGWERDPTLRYTSQGNERVLVKLLDRASRGGRPYWYVVTIGLEAQ